MAAQFARLIEPPVTTQQLELRLRPKDARSVWLTMRDKNFRISSDRWSMLC